MESLLEIMQIVYAEYICHGALIVDVLENLTSVGT
ncbi:uncharacterized protein J3R85_004491 [Psidium guajava]|nr:uncharacterized protein J3R85_004491 [Psidium guajava]